MDVVFATMLILCTGVCLSSLEDMRLDRSLFCNSLFDLRYCLALHPMFPNRQPEGALNALFGYSAFKAAAIIRLVGILTTAFMIVMNYPYSYIPLSLTIVFYFYLFFRLPYALDGGDQMILFVMICFFIMLLDDGSGRYIRLGAAAISLHAAISYFTSGVAKISSPIWRSGDALQSIMSSGEFGNNLLSKLLFDNRKLSKAISWFVMVMHITVAIFIIAGGIFIYPAIAISTAFHIAVAISMRLNNFVFAFGSAMPSIYFISIAEQRSLLRADIVNIFLTQSY